jgi:hypothetical protein
MKKFAVLVALSMVVAFISVPARAEVMLTEPLVEKYINTFPDYTKAQQELVEASKLPDSDAKDKKLTECVAKKNEVLAAKGWTDMSEYMDVDSRVLQIFTQLNILRKFSALPPDRKNKAEMQINEALKAYDPSEVAVMKKYFPKILKLRQDAGLLPR